MVPLGEGVRIVGPLHALQSRSVHFWDAESPADFVLIGEVQAGFDPAGGATCCIQLLQPFIGLRLRWRAAAFASS